MEAVKSLFAGSFGIVWLLAGPITYILNLLDTWRGTASIGLKILISLTLDVFLAMIWPITWALWLGTELMGGSSPLHLIF